MMRFVIAMLKHETNTFSPIPTTIAAFGPDGPLFGQSALAAMRGTATPMGAFIDSAERAGAAMATPVAADAMPGGVVEGAAYERFVAAILDAIARGCDAALLDLHGAMVADGTDDGEGTLLQRIRRLHPRLPIGVALDLHANVTSELVNGATAIAGYKTYPHVDMYETGERVARIILEMLAGQARPVMAWQRLPIIASTLCMGTMAAGPMRDLVERTRSAEECQGVLCATVFGGFPMADVPRPGVSIVVVADGDPAKADTVARKLAKSAWDERARFIYRPEPLSDAIGKARGLAIAAKGPMLLIDHADNCASGGTQDTMHVVAEAMRQGLKDVAVASIRDPEAVMRLIEAGVGNRLRLPLGGKTDLPALGLKGEPLEVEGYVRAITDGRFTITGPMLTGVEANMGRSVVFDTGAITFVVSERPYEPWDLGVFSSLGIEPTRRRFLLLKSRMHYKAAFAPIGAGIVECDGIGVASSNLRLFRFHKLVRPVYPLDQNAVWPELQTRGVAQ
jgi:microcystin degradation protein MlrC